MGVPKRLTEMQRKFANLLVSNEGRKYGYECAIEAGYEKDKLYPLVVKYIGEIREEYQKKYEVTYEKHITELAKIREQALKKGAFSAASNAEVARGKAAGLYVEQKIIRTGKLDDMSKAEMEEELKKIIDEYSPILENVTVDDVKKNIEKKRLPRLKKVSSTSSPKNEVS